MENAECQNVVADTNGNLESISKKLELCACVRSALRTPHGMQRGSPSERRKTACDVTDVADFIPFFDLAECQRSRPTRNIAVHDIVKSFRPHQTVCHVRP